MARSTGLPRAKGVVGIAHVIAARSESVTVDRVTETKGSLDETSTTTSGHTETMWLFEPRESVGNEIAGERIDGSLGGLAVADDTVDLEKDDRITYGGVEYEIDTIVGHPEDGQADGSASPETEFWIVSLVRRQ